MNSIANTSFPPSATGTQQQLQLERDPAMAMAIMLYLLRGTDQQTAVTHQATISTCE